MKKEGRLPVRVYHTRHHDELFPKTLQPERTKATAMGQEDTREDNDGDCSDAHESLGAEDGVQPKFVDPKVGHEADGVASGGRPLCRVSGDGGSLISAHRVKLFSDGSLGKLRSSIDRSIF